MSDKYDSLTGDRWILSQRGNKNTVDPFKPYGCLVEKERTRLGQIEDTGIIFLTNRECPFHCLMCDLWKNTTDDTVPPGAIPKQIAWALEQMPEVKHIKLYNSGSFFDTKAIPEDEYTEIANLLRLRETVIVESHPAFINERCLKFRDLLKPELNVAIGLETIQPRMLKKLNKRMTLDEFRNSVGFLKEHGISSRAFILLRPPFVSETEGIYWAEKSIDFAFNAGVECCTVIPVRSGNGAMEILREKGDFNLPEISSLEEVLEYGINLKSGRVFADTWDLGLFSDCEECLVKRTDRIIQMNLNQEIISPVKCNCKQKLTQRKSGEAQSCTES
jgi:radical SAM enzyme (TIGR01210 family)